MATPDDIQKQLASRQPKVTPVGDVPAATARAAAPPATDVPSVAPTAQATATPAPAALPKPTDFVGDAAGNIQRNTPSAGWSTQPGAGASPISRSAAQITEAPAWQTSPGAAAPEGVTDFRPATPAAPSAGDLSLENAGRASRRRIGEIAAQRNAAGVRAQMLADTPNFGTTPAMPNAAAAPGTGTPPPTAAAAPVTPSGTADAAEMAADDIAKSGMVRRVAGVVGRVAGPALRYAGPIAEVATAGTRIANAGGDAYSRNLLTSGSETQAQDAARRAEIDQAKSEAGGVAGGIAGAKIGAMVPGPAWVKGGAALAGGVVGAIGGQKLVNKIVGNESTGTAMLPDGVYQMPGMPDAVPRLDANGKPAPIPLNTDVLRLQQGGAAAAVDFDKKFGAGTAAYYKGQKVNSNAATALNSSASALTSEPATNGEPKVNLIMPDNPGNIHPPSPADQTPEQAMNSTAPGTAVINGRVLSAKEIADAGKRLNIVPSTAFTNPSLSDLYSQTHGGATPTSDQAIALRNSLNGSASAQRMFGTDASGNPVGVSGGIGAPQDPRQSTIQGLMGQISDALRSGRRRTAKILVDQLSAFDRASQGDMDNSLRRDALNKPQQPAPQTAAQQALDAARAGAAQTQEQVAQMSLAQAKQAQQIQAALQIETDPGKRKVLQQNLAAITGKGGSSANQIKIVNFTVGSGLNTRTIPVPIDLTTGKPVISPEYIQLIQSLQGGQPQAPQKG